MPRDPAPPLLGPQRQYWLTPPKTLHPHPLLPLTIQIKVPRGIKTYPYLPERLFRKTMNTTMMITTKTNEVVPRTLQRGPLIPSASQIILTRGINTNPSLTDRKFTTTMNATTTTTKVKNSREGTSWS